MKVIGEAIGVTDFSAVVVVVVVGVIHELWLQINTPPSVLSG